MRNKIVGMIAVVVVFATLGACAEIERAAEDAARRSGDERLVKVIHGGGNLAGGSLAIGLGEEFVNRPAIGAAPAGYIFVTRGLLVQIRNEAELAAVVGHEIAHVSQKHILQVIQRSKRLAGVTEAGLAYAHQNPEAFKGLIDAAVKKLLDEGLDQEKEIEADQLGDVFAARVGYDPAAYDGLLNQLRACKGDDRPVLN